MGMAMLFQLVSVVELVVIVQAHRLTSRRLAGFNEREGRLWLVEVATLTFSQQAYHGHLPLQPLGLQIRYFDPRFFHFRAGFVVDGIMQEWPFIAVDSETVQSLAPALP